MRKQSYKIILNLVIFLAVAGGLWAQKKPASIWATARFNKKTVMVGEPLVVTISVYTSTWFTEPPVFSEIQVAGALMVRLEQRSGAKTVTIGNKRYPAIEQKFVVYPNKIGENTLPSFEVITSCPPEGDYKSIERTVRTKESLFTVLPPPEGVDTSQWLSAYNLTLTETWNKPLDNLKAGDVLERRIRIRAGGTLAALIPPIVLDTVAFGSIYPKSPILGNIQNSNSFTGSRTEILTYLLESDGSFTIPEVQVPWFNLRKKERETAVVGSISIVVAPNPDIEFILSRQKALQEELAKEAPVVVAEEAPFEFLGLNWWQLILVLLAIIAIVIQLIRWIKKLSRSREKKLQAQRASEEHYFQLLLGALEKGEPRQAIRQLYYWYDRFRGGKFRPALKHFAGRPENKSLLGQLEKESEFRYKEEQWETLISGADELATNLKSARKQQLNEKKLRDEQNWLEINPK